MIIAFAFLGAPERLEPDEQDSVNQLCARHPGLAAAYRLTQIFVRMLHASGLLNSQAWSAVGR